VCLAWSRSSSWLGVPCRAVPGFIWRPTTLLRSADAPPCSVTCRSRSRFGVGDSVGGGRGAPAGFVSIDSIRASIGMLPAPPIELGGGWLAGLLAGRRGPHRAPAARRPCAPDDPSSCLPVLLPARRAPSSMHGPPVYDDDDVPCSSSL
jgi:hypothetical protein